jgi:hypothetical protein
MGAERRAGREVEGVKDRTTEEPPAAVPEEAKQAGDIRARWAWVEPTIWTERMLAALEQGVKGGKRLFCRAGAVLLGHSPCNGLPILSQVNHQLESRMREICLYGSEGGGSPALLPTPIILKPHPAWIPAFAGMTDPLSRPFGQSPW